MSDLVVADAGPLIGLARVDQLSLLTALYSTRADLPGPGTHRLDKSFRASNLLTAFAFQQI